MTNIPIITKEFVLYQTKNALPGVKVKVNDRLGGCVISADVWHFQVTISLNTTQVSLTDEVGQAVMTLTYHPKDIKQEKSASNITLLRVASKNPDKINAFLDGVKNFLRGVIMSLTTAMESLVDRPADIFEDFDDA